MFLSLSVEKRDCPPVFLQRTWTGVVDLVQHRTKPRVDRVCAQPFEVHGSQYHPPFPRIWSEARRVFFFKTDGRTSQETLPKQLRAGKTCTDTAFPTTTFLWTPSPQLTTSTPPPSEEPWNGKTGRKTHKRGELERRRYFFPVQCGRKTARKKRLRGGCTLRKVRTTPPVSFSQMNVSWRGKQLTLAS